MQKRTLNELIEYNDEKLHPKVLINEPGYRMALLSMRAGEVVSIESGAPHRIEAHEDSVFLVLATGKSDFGHDSSGELDLRRIPPPQRHALIFQKFDALAIGDSLHLINDHNPVPLNRQIDSMRQGQASWEYLQRGPEIFRIRIRRIAPPEATIVSLQTQSIWTLPGMKRK